MIIILLPSHEPKFWDDWYSYNLCSIIIPINKSTTPNLHSPCNISNINNSILSTIYNNNYISTNCPYSKHCQITSLLSKQPNLIAFLKWKKKIFLSWTLINNFWKWTGKTKIKLYLKDFVVETKRKVRKYTKKKISKEQDDYDINETKNILKNFGKAILSLLRRT